MNASPLSLGVRRPFRFFDGWDGCLRQKFVSVWYVASELCRRRVWLVLVCAVLAVGTWLGAGHSPQWPLPLAQAKAGAAGSDDALVRSQPVCIINTQDSAGDIGKSLVVRHRREGDRLWVSYFVYWTSERPWGDKPLLLSLAIDAFYSHFLFVFPGVRHALYGPGDVEGVTVVYRVEGDRLEVIEGFGDDEYHRRVHLGPEDLTGDDHTVLMTTSWSHQLGGRGGASFDQPPASRHCFTGRQMVPLSREIADRFWLGSSSDPRRARYAWL